MKMIFEFFPISVANVRSISFIVFIAKHFNRFHCIRQKCPKKYHWNWKIVSLASPVTFHFIVAECKSIQNEHCIEVVLTVYPFCISHSHVTFTIQVQTNIVCKHTLHLTDSAAWHIKPMLLLSVRKGIEYECHHKIKTILHTRCGRISLIYSFMIHACWLRLQHNVSKFFARGESERTTWKKK